MPAVRARRRGALGRRSAVLALVLLVASGACSGDGSELFMVTGVGDGCDADACPPGRTWHQFGLVPPGRPLSDSRQYDVPDSVEVPALANVPECVRVQLDDDVVTHWEPADCPTPSSPPAP